MEKKVLYSEDYSMAENWLTHFHNYKIHIFLQTASLCTVELTMIFVLFFWFIFSIILV